MGLYLGEEMTFAFPTTRHPTEILTATLAIPTAHRAGTATQQYGSAFARTFLAGTYNFTPDEVETFYETNKK